MERSRIVVVMSLVAVVAIALFAAVIARPRPSRLDSQSAGPASVSGEEASAGRTTPLVPGGPPAPASKPVVAKAVDPVRQGEVLHDATLLELIRIAKAAVRTGDDATKRAMLAGLKKEPARAGELIRQERARTSDAEDAAALGQLMNELQ